MKTIPVYRLFVFVFGLHVLNEYREQVIEDKNAKINGLFAKGYTREVFGTYFISSGGVV